MNAFDEVFGGLFNNIDTKEYEEELNKLYWTDPKYYLYRVQKLKDAGYRVYRNSAGKHKVKGGGYFA